MKYAIILILSVAITVIHRIWNSAPVNKVNWFINSSKSQDVQWYIKDNFDMLSGIMVMWVVYSLSKKVSQKLSNIALVILIYKVIGVFGYWYNFNTFDYIYVLFIVPFGLILILFKK